jgi:hypothetical protein
MLMRLALLGGLLMASPCWAGDLAVSLKTPTGKPVADAVAMVVPQSGLPRGPLKFSWPYRMAQKDIAFSPFVLIVPVGAEVAFPNFDSTRHHVYSFSPAKTFELKLYGRDETRSVKMDKAGVVALGCNIHDSMSAFIRVVDTPYAGKTSAAGDLVLHDLPPGPATVTLWHPYSKAPKGETVRTVTIPAQGSASLSASLDLRMPPMHHSAY